MAAIVDPIALVHSFIWNDVRSTSADSERCQYTALQKDVNMFYGMSAEFRENTSSSTLAFRLDFMEKYMVFRTTGKPQTSSRFLQTPFSMR